MVCATRLDVCQRVVVPHSGLPIRVPHDCKLLDVRRHNHFHLSHFIGKSSACCLKIKILHKKNTIYSLPNNTYSIDCMISEVMIPRLSPFSFLILHILDSSSHILVPPTRYAGKRGKKEEEEGVGVTGI